MSDEQSRRQVEGDGGRARIAQRLQAGQRFDPRRPFTRADARSAGFTSGRMQPRFRRVLHGVYVDRDVAVTDQLVAEVALALSPPGSCLSHATAARHWRGIVPPDPQVHVSVVDGTARTRRDGIRAHAAPAGADVVVHRGQRVTTPSATFLDMAAPLSLVDLVVLGDSLVAAGVVTSTQLVQAAHGSSQPGVRLARRAAGLVRSGAESPMETRVRLLIVLAGLPEPVVQHTIVVRGGVRRYRVDLWFPTWRIAIEYDGRHHADDARQWQHDLTRREDLDGEDVRMIVLRAPDIYATPGQTLQRIVQAVRARGGSVRPPSEAWRRHFPGRAAA